MDHLRQTRKNNCGQTCLSMVSGVPVELVEAALGKTGKTRTRDLIRFLREQGYECPERLMHFNGVQSLVGVPCIAKLVWKARDTGKVTNSHWVVRTELGRWHDPTQMPGVLSPGSLITSVLPFTKSAAKRSA